MASSATANPVAGIPAREPVAELARIGITAFTTTRAHGDFSLAAPAHVAANSPRWTELQRSLEPASAGLVSALQVHGEEVATHRDAWEGWRRIEGFDAHIVAASRGAAAVTIADCVPVFIAHPSGSVALVHAGWRGTAARLVAKVVAAMGEPAAELALHLGPGICGRCYEVGPEVYERLTGWQTIRQRHVDLRALLAEQAKHAGVVDVSASPWCTKCDNGRFFSHRAGDAGRQIAVIVAGARGSTEFP